MKGNKIMEELTTPNLNIEKELEKWKPTNTIDFYKLCLEDLIEDGLNAFGYEKTLSAIVNVAMKITAKEVKKRKEEERKENDK